MARKKAVEEEPVQEEVAPEREESSLAIETFHRGMMEHKRFLVYGESGVGKTVFASTWPDVLFLDIEDGMGSVKRKVDRVVIQHWDDLDAIYQFLKGGEHSYKTVVIDSLNEAQTLAMDATIEEFPNIRRSYDSLPGQSDYGKMLYDFDVMVRDYKRLPMNVVMIAQTTTKVFDTDIIQPQLIGKQTSRNLCRKMDIIGYLYKAEGSENMRMMSFDAAEYVTKDRSGKLPLVVENPTYSKLEKYWRNE